MYYIYIGHNFSRQQQNDDNSTCHLFLSRYDVIENTTGVIRYIILTDQQNVEDANHGNELVRTEQIQISRMWKMGIMEMSFYTEEIKIYMYMCFYLSDHR